MLVLALIGSIIAALVLGVDCLARGDFVALPGVLIGGLLAYGLLRARIALAEWWAR